MESNATSQFRKQHHPMFRRIFQPEIAGIHSNFLSNLTMLHRLSLIAFLLRREHSGVTGSAFPERLLHYVFCLYPVHNVKSMFFDPNEFFAVQEGRLRKSSARPNSFCLRNYPHEPSVRAKMRK